MIIVFGIKNCDSVKKACNWLKKNDIEFEFHDFRKDGLTQTKIQSWAKNIDWETLLNRRGTTWRKLTEQEKSSINKTRAIKLMTEHPTLIKRPIIEFGKQLVVGFSTDSYQQLFDTRG